MYEVPSMSDVPREFSHSAFFSLWYLRKIFHNTLTLHTKYLQFLKFLHTSPYSKPWSEIFSIYGYWIRQRKTVIFHMFTYYHPQLCIKKPPHAKAVWRKDKGHEEQKFQSDPSPKYYLRTPLNHQMSSQPLSRRLTLTLRPSSRHW